MWGKNDSVSKENLEEFIDSKLGNVKNELHLTLKQEVENEVKKGEKDN